MGSDLSVVNAARVSFGKTSDWNPDWRDDHYTSLLTKDSKLIKYLADHKHMSPFGHCFASFHVACPLYVHAQLTKHEYLRHQMHSLDLYRDMVTAGVCPEQARGVLPQSTMTEWWWSGSLDAWADMCKLRMAPDSQYESQLVARGISGIMSGLFEASWAALVPVSIRPFDEEESARSLERSKINKN